MYESQFLFILSLIQDTFFLLEEPTNYFEFSLSTTIPLGGNHGTFH